MCLTLITWDCGCLHMSKLRVYTVNTYSSLWKTSHSNKVKNKTTPASPSPWVKSRIHYGLLTGSHMRKPPFSSVISSRVHFPFFIMLQPHWFSLFIPLLENAKSFLILWTLCWYSSRYLKKHLILIIEILDPMLPPQRGFPDHSTLLFI